MKSQFLHVPVPAPSSASSSVFDFPLAQKQDHSPSPNYRPPSGLLDQPTSVSYLVISGGTGCNSICSAFGQNATYILPVSDNGGSSSEIIRVLGGPSIGDIRSRLVRLIPTSHERSPLEAIRTLMAHRLSSGPTDRDARDEWRDIVEGRSHLWARIPADRKETIRGFLVYFESELLKRAHKNFSFRNGSVGNYFLAAAQGFFRSLPSAIFLFSSITGSQAQILPVLVTNHTVTIAALLESGSRVIGQCEISHPVPNPVSFGTTTFNFHQGLEDELEEQPRNVVFQKGDPASTEYPVLDSRIKRVYYINAYGQEIYPSPNPQYLLSIATHKVLVYSCGSLWTSIIPCLALSGVASAIAKSPTLRAKVLLLNSENDRETHHYKASDYIRAIVDTLNRHNLNSQRTPYLKNEDYPASAFITHLIYTHSTSVLVDQAVITSLGVKCVEVGQAGSGRFESASLQGALDKILAAA